MAREPKYKDSPAELTPGVNDLTPPARSPEDVSLQDEAILVETSDGDSSPSRDFPVVGIGSSAPFHSSAKLFRFLLPLR
jgi:hypothetical protein